MKEFPNSSLLEGGFLKSLCKGEKDEENLYEADCETR